MQDFDDDVDEEEEEEEEEDDDDDASYPESFILFGLILQQVFKVISKHNFYADASEG